MRKRAREAKEARRARRANRIDDPFDIPLTEIVKGRSDGFVIGPGKQNTNVFVSFYPHATS
jgi:hypothetical protein